MSYVSSQALNSICYTRLDGVFENVKLFVIYAFCTNPEYNLKCYFIFFNVLFQLNMFCKSLITLPI